MSSPPGRPGSRLRSKETRAGSTSRSARRIRTLAGNTGRVVALVAIVLGSGALAGLALGYPIRSLDLGASGAVTLDQEALANTIDVEQALVSGADLPKSYEPAPDLAAGVALIGATYCGYTVAPDAIVGQPLTAAFLDRTNNAFILSEVVKVKQQNDAGKYIKELTGVFDGCPDQRYFTGTGASKVRLEISNPRKRDEPLELDYLTRTLKPEGGGTTQIISYFQVGNVIVAINYAGPDKPDKNLISKAEDEILYRVAPDQFARTTKVPGEKKIPLDTTTTIDDAVQPSPTSSPPTLAPPPPPTFEPPTTTRPKRSSGTTRAPATTAPGG